MNSSQVSISRSLPSLPQPQTTALYRHTQSYAIPSPSSVASSPPLSSLYAQRSTPSSAQELYYRQQQQQQQQEQQQHHATSSTSLRASTLLSSSSSATGVHSMSLRRAQLEYPQAQAHPSSAYTSSAAVTSTSASTQRYRGTTEDSLGWYRRPAFEPYTASACT